MTKDRKTAVIVGLLFIIATVAGVLAAVLGGPIYDSGYLAIVSANENQLIIGAFLLIIMGVAVASISFMMFPILRRHNEALALGYVVFRVLEGALAFVGPTIWLLLIILSQGFVKAGAPDASYFQTLGTLLLGVSDWVHVPMDIVFGLGALIFYGLLYQSKLIPRWLSGWGFIAGVLVLVSAGSLDTSGPGPFSAIQIVLSLPIAVNEMAVAVWLIVKGFNSSAIASESARRGTNKV